MADSNLPGGVRGLTDSRDFDDYLKSGDNQETDIIANVRKGRDEKLCGEKGGDGTVKKGSKEEVVATRASARKKKWESLN